MVLLHTLENSVLRLALNRTSSYNAFNREMALALQDQLDSAAENDDVRAILITGEGKAFCSGQDLSEAIDPEGPGLDRILSEHYNPLVLKMRELAKPIVVAVNGVAAGAGANLALAGDIILASESASFIQAFSKIGLIPDTGGTLTLPRLVGPAKALAWMMLGDKISAEEAERAGMIYKVYPAEALMDEAQKLAEMLAKAPTQAFALTKKAVNASTYAGLKAQLELERALQNEAGATADFKEGVAAFLEKRCPQFTGK
ncbi:MAG TPA: 2-(1,2-epoxy-1,2-dihydrophenyl)acetyl-CoA isomerase [Cryomorphaceae bacterium]|nr:2-(1,2-epoxy-1,2-dihydrophenyl)acetyl-CoA isomerase [Cryomorphaceae bacterium]